MGAPRSLPDAVELPTPPQPTLDPVEALAAQWVRSAPAAEPGTVARLATVLRRFAALLAAEPFWPPLARDTGADLLGTGLCGDPGDLPPGAADVLAPGLGLLRSKGVAAFGLVGKAGRLGPALDELATGFARGLRERPDREQAALLRAREDAERALAVCESHYRTVYAQGALGIGIASLDGRVLDLNPALCRMFGLDSPHEKPCTVADLVHPEDAADLVERYERLVDDHVRPPHDVLRHDVRFVRPDGRVLWARMVAAVVRDDEGAPLHVIALVEDVSERYRLHSRLQQASYQDQLMQLPNRSLTEEWLHRAFARAGDRRVGLCALDLDDFTRVNDGLGHQVGDQLLLAVASRLQVVAGRHLVTRTGGDEFAVLVADPAGLAEMCQVADRLLAALTTPFVIGAHSLTVTASIGVAETPTEAGCPGELMRAAAVALSWAKTHGGGRRVVFDPERDAGESARFALLAGLRGAIDRSELRLAFQPLVGLADGRVHGAEALVRWQHPVEGLLGPGRFIELAEHSGAIVPLGRWVLEEACRQAASWWRELGGAAARADLPTPYVSVNVSPVQLGESGWVHDVTGVLDDTGLPPDRLQLEITERAVLGDEAAALDALSALRRVGVRLALDDFGTGYSSLAWLRRLPVHALKIDGSFIDGLRHPAADPVDASIVRALVDLAHALGLEVTAEWVETCVQARRLATLGCDTGQGRWFGDAGPAERVPGLWRRSIEDGGLPTPPASHTANR